MPAVRDVGARFIAPRGRRRKPAAPLVALEPAHPEGQHLWLCRWRRWGAA